MKIRRARAAAYLCVLCFWAISLAYLERFPPINPDEAWILSVGYQFFSRGTLGSELFAGFYGMEQHYFEFMPLMSLAQGTGARLYGVGVFQMRFEPVAFGTLILALTFAIARELEKQNESTALLAMLLLVLWQWLPGGDWRRATGIPLVDISRIARYDVLAALLGLGALWQFIRARQTNSRARVFLSGVFAALAGLAQLYGLVWVAVLVFAAVANGSRRNIALMLIGAMVAWMPWLAFISLNWNDFVGQTRQNDANFDLLNPGFYQSNLLTEANRYSFGAEWLFVLGALFAITLLLARVFLAHDDGARLLFIPTFFIPIVFALLLKSKLPDYLITLTPWFALALALGIRQLWDSRHRAARAAIAVFVATIALNGATAVAAMQMRASQAPSPQKFFAELEDTLPHSARVLGHPQYWLALNDSDYRSFVLPFLLSNPSATLTPISFRRAMEEIAPTIVLMDAEISQAINARPTIREQFWAFVRVHNGRVLRELRDPDGNPFLVYQIDPEQ